MTNFIARREPQALLFLASHRGEYLRLVQMPRGVGRGVMAALIDKGHVTTAPATRRPREIGYAATDLGLAWLRDHEIWISQLPSSLLRPAQPASAARSR
jgi:hypothetical protein